MHDDLLPMVHSDGMAISHGKDNSAGDSEKNKKERKQTEDEIGKQHQIMDRNRVWVMEDRERQKCIAATLYVVP